MNALIFKEITNGNENPQMQPVASEIKSFPIACDFSFKASLLSWNRVELFVDILMERLLYCYDMWRDIIVMSQSPM